MIEQIKEFFADIEPYEGESSVKIIISRATEDSICFFISNRSEPPLCGGHYPFFNAHSQFGVNSVDELIQILSFFNDDCGYEIVVDLGWFNKYFTDQFI